MPSSNVLLLAGLAMCLLLGVGWFMYRRRGGADAPSKPKSDPTDAPPKSDPASASLKTIPGTNPVLTWMPLSPETQKTTGSYAAALLAHNLGFGLAGANDAASQSDIITASLGKGWTARTIEGLFGARGRVATKPGPITGVLLKSTAAPPSPVRIASGDRALYVSGQTVVLGKGIGIPVMQVPLTKNNDVVIFITKDNRYFASDVGANNRLIAQTSGRSVLTALLKSAGEGKSTFWNAGVPLSATSVGELYFSKSKPTVFEVKPVSF